MADFELIEQDVPFVKVTLTKQEVDWIALGLGKIGSRAEERGSASLSMAFFRLSDGKNP